MAMVRKEMSAGTGHANPLRLVGKKLAAQYRVICLDELYITDMGDAMIVYHLFESLFDEGVTLLITSNFAPERLYRDDLQPAIFEPAIKLIRANTEELHLASNQDYRKLQVGEHQTWFEPGERDFAALFNELNQQLHQSQQFDTAALAVQEHGLQAQRYAQSLAWFSFAELCEKPRSARDYLQLAQRFKVFLLSDVPQFGNREVEEQLTQGVEEGSIGGQRYAYSNSENAQRRFMSLVDELYDQGIKLYVQGAVPLFDLYTGGRLAFEFQRTISRLTEMQSAAYRDRALRA
jgi:cell division protein ZapE